MNYRQTSLGYLDLLHETQMLAIRESIRREDGKPKISTMLLSGSLSGVRTKHQQKKINK